MVCGIGDDTNMVPSTALMGCRQESGPGQVSAMHSAGHGMGWAEVVGQGQVLALGIGQDAAAGKGSLLWDPVARGKQ